VPAESSNRAVDDPPLDLVWWAHMNRTRFVVLLAAPALVALVAVACDDSGSSTSPNGVDGGGAAFDASTSDALAQSDSGSSKDASTDTSTDSGDAGICRTALSFWDGGPLLVPSPYKEFPDSPFACATFGTYFHLATFEGDGGLPPGTTGPGSKFPGTGGSSTITDSVDGDDGFPDGAPPDSGATVPCPGCQSWFGGSMDFQFDEGALGGLPTHAGMVWTDDGNNATVTFTAYAGDGGVIATQAVPGIGTAGISGETDEDRFFGVVFPGGVKRITMSHTGGGIEIDHLQIGR